MSRIYVNVAEAIEEVKRDLAEMGIKVLPKTMQDKVIEGNSNYETMELQNYSYTILDCKSSEVPGVSQPWADAEFEERVWNPYYATRPISSVPFINPGKAYLLRKEIWDDFLHNGKFGYTYNERIHHNNQLEAIINRIKVDPGSRQLWLSLWSPDIDPENIGAVSRVPCSLGYNFQVREGKLNIHYVMRSCDFATHFRNDIYLGMKLLEYVAEETGYEVGSFTHTMFSLHVYKKDVQEVF